MTTIPPQAPLDQSRALELLERMVAMHESELGCDECTDRMECLAELTMVGKTPQGALAAIQRHIECCGCCRKEYEALLVVMQMERADQG
jgi:hypothetical protein